MEFEKDFYTISEACDILGIHPMTIYKHRNQGRGAGMLFVKPSVGKIKISKTNLKKILDGTA